MGVEYPIMLHTGHAHSPFQETRPIIIIYLSPAPKNQVAEERQHYLGRSEPLDWRSWARLGKSRVDSKQVVSSL
ncbi:hypothetical protein FOVSG1_014335 [Fusarium oxysporum f. sp. vasinfectum]